MGTPALRMVSLAEILSPISRITSGGGPDEDEAGVLHALGEIGVLGQEAEPRVDGLGVRDLGRADDGRHVEVAARRGRRPDAHRLIGEQHVLQAGVGGGMHRDGLDAELPAGALDAQRHLAAVGYEDLVEHRVRTGLLAAATG